VPANARLDPTIENFEAATDEFKAEAKANPEKDFL
jgi:hypothetical protein